jgi:hypothetical protein
MPRISGEDLQQSAEIIGKRRPPAYLLPLPLPLLYIPVIFLAPFVSRTFSGRSHARAARTRSARNARRNHVMVANKRSNGRRVVSANLNKFRYPDPRGSLVFNVE